MKALAADDFYANESLFTPTYVSNMMAAAHEHCPSLAFLPVNYDLSNLSTHITTMVSTAFAGAYGSFCSGLILPLLNSANYEDFSAEGGEITHDAAIMKGEIAQFVVSYPPNLTSSAGDYSALNETITTPTGFPDAPYPFQLRYSDNDNGPTAGYHLSQVLVDGVVVWQQDVAGATGVTNVTLNLQNQIRGKTQATITARMYDAKRVYNFAVIASWDVPAGNWSWSKTGAFMSTGTYYPAVTNLNVPVIVMIYDGGYGVWHPTTEYLVSVRKLVIFTMMTDKAR